MTLKPLALSIAYSALLTSTSVLAQQTQTIMEVQGKGETSPLVDVANHTFQSKDSYLVTGVITTLQHTPLGKDIATGFYMQDAVGDDDAQTSDGIFVTASEQQLTALKTGDKVAVLGKVKEAYGWTQLAASKITTLGYHGKLPAHIIKPLPSDHSLKDTLERYEGMYVTIVGDLGMKVSRNFGYDRRVRRNNLALAKSSINTQPNQDFAPGSTQSLKQAQQIQDNELILESFNKAPAGIIPWYPNFAKQTDYGYNYIRLGDSVTNFTGVIGYSHNAFRLFVSSTANEKSFIHNIPRTNAPDLKQGDIVIATFNVLNYFNSPFGGAQNPTKKSRGAKTNDEFTMQRSKIVKAILALDADIIGLMEIENNGTGKDSALADLLTHVNAGLPTNKQYTFAASDNKFNGTGAITSQVIYRPSKMSLSAFTVIDMPQQDAPKVGKESGKNYMRNAITPTFILNGSNELLTVSVNHFKSKGSTCWEDVALQNNNDKDHQGSCEQFRVSGAYHLAKELEKIDGHTLIIGDLNSYALEDPLSVLTNRDHLAKEYKIHAARDTFIGGNQTTGKLLHGNQGAEITESFGYINTVRKLHPNAFGYSFSNVVGTLDYILASPSLANHIVDATEWNINSPESTLFEYGKRYTGDMKKYNDVYRSSDHDPVLISLSFSNDTADKGDINPEKTSGGLGFVALITMAGLMIRRRLVS